VEIAEGITAIQKEENSLLGHALMKGRAKLSSDSFTVAFAT
jgi:hypothetical protein